jgi:hypothetical protein
MTLDDSARGSGRGDRSAGDRRQAARRKNHYPENAEVTAPTLDSPLESGGLTWLVEYLPYFGTGASECRPVHAGAWPLVELLVSQVFSDRLLLSEQAIEYLTLDEREDVVAASCYWTRRQVVLALMPLRETSPLTCQAVKECFIRDINQLGKKPLIAEVCQCLGCETTLGRGTLTKGICWPHVAAELEDRDWRIAWPQ